MKLEGALHARCISLTSLYIKVILKQKTYEPVLGAHRLVLQRCEHSVAGVLRDDEEQEDAEEDLSGGTERLPGVLDEGHSVFSLVSGWFCTLRRVFLT